MGHMATDVVMPSRRERAFFTVCAIIVICVGVVQICIGGWLAWEQWLMVSRWPRVQATVLSKQISEVGVRVEFSYEVDGRRQSGVGFRWGTKQEVESSLKAYEPGTIQVISYDPQDPGRVNIYLAYTWQAFRPSSVAAVLGVLFIVGGRTVWKWAGGW